MANGMLRPLKRSAMAQETHDKIITGLIRGIYPLASSIAHNTDVDNVSSPWVQRTVSTELIRKEDLSRIRRVSRARLEELTESIDDLFMAYETLHSKDNDRSESQKIDVGIGVYYYETKP